MVLRRALSAALAGASVLLVVLQLRPPGPPVVGVLVAGRDVAAGTVLAAEHLRRVHVPRTAVQPGALTHLTAAVGRRVGSGLAVGEALTGSRLVARTAADGLEPGRVALHVVASDPASVDLLVPGAAARVYPAGGGPPLARHAEVLATDPPSGRGDLLATHAPVGRGVVLALSRDEADAVLTGHGSTDGPVVVTVVTG